MILEQLSLGRQIDLAFREIAEELAHLTSGIVFVQIRNNTVGKFGIRHDPIESKDGKMKEQAIGLSPVQMKSFRQLAVQSLKFKRGWTHGEIQFEFAVRHNVLATSIQFESSYNMASLKIKYDPYELQVD